MDNGNTLPEEQPSRRGTVRRGFHRIVHANGVALYGHRYEAAFLLAHVGRTVELGWVEDEPTRIAIYRLARWGRVTDDDLLGWARLSELIDPKVSMAMREAVARAAANRRAGEREARAGLLADLADTHTGASVAPPITEDD